VTALWIALAHGALELHPLLHAQPVSIAQQELKLPPLTAKLVTSALLVLSLRFLAHQATLVMEQATLTLPKCSALQVNIALVAQLQALTSTAPQVCTVLPAQDTTSHAQLVLTTPTLGRAPLQSVSLVLLAPLAQPVVKFKTTLPRSTVQLATTAQMIRL